MYPAIVLFDRDLRLRDNPALYAAAKTSKPLILLYILDEEARPLGEAQKFWLYHSLKTLEKDLIFKKGKTLEILSSLIRKTKADALYTSMLEPSFKKLGIAVHTFQPNFLIDPTKILTVQGTYFKVFAPFWRRCLEEIDPPKPYPVPKWRKAKGVMSSSFAFLLKTNSYWEPGEKSAQQKLQIFVKNGLKDYEQERNRLDRPTTSFLSPHLHFGEISINAVWHAVRGKSEAFMRELGFREFSNYLLFHVPDLPKKNYNREIRWRNNRDDLVAWQNGKTGYPLVDAAMRQLKASGWMHNRARMIVASFLVKDLHIDWRKGQRWFWEHLVDGDRAINAFNWQWVAGTGPDASPYFRVFNPQLQAKRYDPQGEFVRTWLPELAHLPGKKIHTPWEYEKNYPSPIVDHAEERRRFFKSV